jgi:hypothetical protein
MLSLKEKQDILVKKWNELHPPQIDKAAIALEEVRAAVRSLSSTTVKKPAGVKNSNKNLLTIMEPIEWHGNIAIGESSQFIGWVNVVPPGHGSIGYFGPSALSNARIMAKKLMSQYS